jgi:DNA-directed RNA polymerase specialized sigma24 family protein
MTTSSNTKLETPRKNAAWCFLFLEHLDEFATLAWYLVADSRLVEVTVIRTMARLDEIPFDASTPALAYHQARETLIAEAIAALALSRDEGDEDGEVQPYGLAELPDLPRLAFLLKLVLHLSEGEVARFLDINPAKVGQLVKHAIDRISMRIPLSGLLGFHDA